ncbi:helix-turn-helix domain-containing protein [Endozoicomonas sp. Mp262]|uniref:helix-turn-helix domain-containing protein n=1 Tax=Endozoicomonas sp. Mp262 TaxID=2919499 RepID=UPI0021DB0E6E
MTTTKNDWQPAKKQIDVSVGESLRIMRELQEISQSELSRLTGIPQPAISQLESDELPLGVNRAKVLAKALRCHPAVLLFPGWDMEQPPAA